MEILLAVSPVQKPYCETIDAKLVVGGVIDKPKLVPSSNIMLLPIVVAPVNLAT